MTTKTKKTILLSSLLAALILPLGNTAIAESNISTSDADLLKEQVKDMDTTSKEYFDLIKRDPLTVNEMNLIKKIIRENSETSDELNESSKILAVSFVGNAKQIPVHWYPVVHILEDKQITSIKIDMDSNDVISSEKYQNQKLTNTNPLAVDRYDGSVSIGKGIRVTSPTQPTGYDGDDTTSGFSAVTLNAMAYGSDPDNYDLCDSANSADHYWMQTGYKFNKDGWKIVFADTETDCGSFDSGLPAPSTTDDIIFNIYSGSTWYGVIHNVDESDFAYHYEDAPTTTYIGKDTGAATSVFMENGYTSSGWEAQFSDTTFDMTDAEFVKTDSTSIDWSGEEQYHVDCNGDEVTEEVISGTLVSGGTATWDVEEMADYSAC
ncbi:MAG: hypothetical protein KC483_02550 [Nitrosarchaeum sp.]|nr:hypothetical protein [Nitrosarchaeum sp.]MCA9820871.1 hypothetical protein [Nitrosarchaeum sp.]